MSSPDGVTDRKWRIWAHRAICTGGLNNMHRWAQKLRTLFFCTGWPFRDLPFDLKVMLYITSQWQIEGWNNTKIRALQCPYALFWKCTFSRDVVAIDSCLSTVGTPVSRQSRLSWPQCSLLPVALYRIKIGLFSRKLQVILWSNPKTLISNVLGMC